MTEVNYWLVGFMCITIIVCYTIGFMMGQIFEQSKQKDKAKAKQKKADKKIIRKR